MNGTLRPRSNMVMRLSASLLVAVLMLVGHALSAESAGLEVDAAHCGHSTAYRKTPIVQAAKSNVCSMLQSRHESPYTAWCTKMGSRCVSRPFAAIKVDDR